MYSPSFYLAALFALVGNLLLANNIQITNSELTGNTGTSALIQFDLSWENSWRGGAVTNWDAAWVFVKYRTSTSGPWRHANLANVGHVAAPGSQIEPGPVNPGIAFNVNTNPVVGVLIYRDGPGTGNLSLPGTQLRWNFALQGLNYADIVQVQVFGIEMVHVPQGAFAVGSGGSETLAFTLTTIATANATTAPGGVGALGGMAGGHPSGQTAPASPNWPNGFNAFYVMKYEIGQQQYVDFLNTLTRQQQAARTELALTEGNPNIGQRFALSNMSTVTARNGVRCAATIDGFAPATFFCDLNNNGVGGEATDGQWIACNFLYWEDVAAYLDWSGLRPMTELEYEKACRGTLPPVANEYPWGTTTAATSAYTLSSPGATNEGIATNYSSTLGNAGINSTSGSINGPVRVGAYSANGSNIGRVTAGASYYGIMELGGNVGERAIALNAPLGAGFLGIMGNGTLQANGTADVASWPNDPSGAGAGFRGGAFDEPPASAQTSHRGNINLTITPDRFPGFGGRGVRSAP